MTIAYMPTGVFTSKVSSSLSHDTITADTIPVFDGSITPLAAFINPNSGFTEALVVTVDDDDQPVLGHITRASGGPGGWTVNRLSVVAQEVAAGTAYSGVTGGPPGMNQPYGFYHDGTSLYGMTLNGAAWETTPLGSAITNMKVAYSPNGVMALYGVSSDGALVTYSQDGGIGQAWVPTTWNLAVSGDVRMILNDGASGTNWQAASIAGGQLTIAQGVLGNTEVSSQETVVAGGASQIVMGFWSTYLSSASFLYLDQSGSFHNYCGTSVPLVIETQSPTVASATGLLQNESDGSTTLHVYGIDTAGSLWVLHQDPTNPWSQSGTPNFARGFLRLGSGVAGVVSDMNPADAPTLFAVDKSEITERSNSVRLHRQDPQSRYWFSDNMFTTAVQTFDVVRFRTEVSFFDAYGIPVTNYPLTLSVPIGGTGVEVETGGQSYFVSGAATAPAPTVAVHTDVHGRLTMAVMASSGLSTPPLIVSGVDASGAPFSITVEANLPIHDYLAGNGTLNPTNPGGGLPLFDAAGTTLGKASFGGTSIIDAGTPTTTLASVAGAVQQLGKKAVSVSAMKGFGYSQGDAIGFTIDFRNASQPTFISFTDRGAFDAHMATFHVEGLFSWISNFAGDVWHGIENAAISVATATYDAISNIVSLTLEGIESAVSFVVSGIEDIAHAVASVFMWVVDKIEMVIAWLKALFDLEAIWRTKNQFQSAITVLIGDGTAANPGYIVQALASKAGAANNWFTEQQATIDAAFQTLRKNYSGTATFGAQPGFAAPGAPSSSSIAGSSVSPSDCTSNVHHNWLHDKISSGGPATSPGQNDGSLASVWTTFESSLGTSLTDFEKAFESFASALGSVIQDPSTIGSVGIADFLTGVNYIIDAVLQLADAIVQGLAGMAETVMQSIAGLLNTPIENAFLQTIWDWISGGSEPLTILSVMSLLAAFPTTIIYTLISGSEPFPASAAMAFAAGSVAALPLIAAIMQILSVIPSGISLALGAAAPWYMTLFNVVLAGLIYLFSGGIRDFSTVGWIGVGAVAVNIVWIVPAALFILKGMAAATAQQTLDVLGDGAKVLETVAGAVSMIFAGLATTLASPPPTGTQTAWHMLTSVPSVFATLQTTELRDGPWGGYATTLAAALLAVGCIGGGSAELIDAVG